MTKFCTPRIGFFLVVGHRRELWAILLGVQSIHLFFRRRQIKSLLFCQNKKKTEPYLIDGPIRCIGPLYILMYGKNILVSERIIFYLKKK
jgi:hypothetical protein